MRERMREFADCVSPQTMDKVKKNLHGLTEHYAVRSLPCTVREIIDGMWMDIGKGALRYFLEDCDAEEKEIAEIAHVVIERCPRHDLRLKMRMDVIKKALELEHDQYLGLLADPASCFEWIEAVDPDGLRSRADEWTRCLATDALGVMNARRAREALIAAEEAEESKREDARRREAEDKKRQRTKKQLKHAEKQRAAREAKDARDEKRAAKWRQSQQSQPKPQPAPLPLVWEGPEHDDARPQPVTAAPRLVECRVCMEDVAAGAIAMPCGHDQVCDACASALVRDKLLACVQCMEPVCMYVSHDGECICTAFAAEA